VSLKNRKILYDELMAKGNIREANRTIANHPEMVDKPKEEPEPIKRTRSRSKK